MPHKLSLFENTTIIKITFDGLVTPEEVGNTMMENVKLAKEYQTSLFLVDCKEMEDV